jgi:putative NIF3 family GTP cyclohydrolase 1 type 2
VQHALRTTGVEAAAGKSNKLQRDKPYDSVVEALRVLFNRLLSSGPGNIARARDDLHRALDGHARVIADLVAEAGHVLGPTAPLAEVPAYIALTRAQNAICRVLEFFATAARPWWCFSTICNGPMPLRWGHCRADQPRARSPCLIGAYRDGEEMTGELADLVTMARTKQDRLVEIAVQPLSLKQLAGHQRSPARPYPAVCSADRCHFQQGSGGIRFHQPTLAQPARCPVDQV